MSTTKPTFIFVPGAWHKASCWSKVTSNLSTHGYKSLTPTLPSTLGDSSATFSDDLNAVRSAITSETTQGRDVIVVTWSYGSLPGASAMRGLTKPKSGEEGENMDEGANGHVIGFAMIATGFCATGFDFLTSGGGKPPPFWEISSSGFAEFTIDANGIRELFYHDLPVEEGAMWVGEVTKQSLKSLNEGGELVYAGWKDVPCWFLATKGDRGLPFEVQKMLVGMAREQGGEVEMREVESGHAPMLSRPEETTEFLLEAARAFVG
ncbi:Alpha/beta hydrolase fold-1 [Rhexocercosporidium sp. MPI-PUGE-AT-0058]|nr:Alpha/beta hydrolase fold-1 [Rhexocercosporidium sp. MPI-PUGE-AT-0058]